MSQNEHAGVARATVANIGGAWDSPEVPAIVTEALMEATLAVAYEARTQNLISLLAAMMPRDRSLLPEAKEMLVEIKERLDIQ